MSEYVYKAYILAIANGFSTNNSLGVCQEILQEIIIVISQKSKQRKISNFSVNKDHSYIK